MSACLDVVTKRKTFVRTQKTATFNVRRIKDVNKRSMGTTLKTIGSHAAVNSTVRTSKSAKAIKLSEIIVIETANALLTFVKTTYVIKLANKIRKTIISTSSLGLWRF